jgi:hypothetical protein
MYVPKNNNLASSKIYYGVLIRLCHGKGWKKFSHIRYLRGRNIALELRVERALSKVPLSERVSYMIFGRTRKILCNILYVSCFRSEKLQKCAYLASLCVCPPVPFWEVLDGFSWNFTLGFFKKQVLVYFKFSYHQTKMSKSCGFLQTFRS